MGATAAAATAATTHIADASDGAAARGISEHVEAGYAAEAGDWKGRADAATGGDATGLIALVAGSDDDECRRVPRQQPLGAIEGEARPALVRAIEIDGFVTPKDKLTWHVRDALRDACAARRRPAAIIQAGARL